MPLRSDLPYRAPGSAPHAERCRADLHLPEGADGPVDLLVWLHGGGLVEGDKVGPDTLLAAPCAARGIAVATPTYRFLQHAPFPACIEDAAAAIAWAPGALAREGLACRRLFVGGMSAGAYLAAMVALDPAWLAPHGLTPAALAGVIPLSGQMMSHFNYRPTIGHPVERPLIDRYAPLWHVRADAPPLLLITGDDDMPCRVEENRLMVAALRQAGHRRSACHVIPCRTHGTIAAGLGDPADAVARLILAFLAAPEQTGG